MRLFSPVLLILTLACASSAEAATLECKQLPNLFEAFERNHYVVREVDEQVRQRAVTKFIEAIDSQRLLLLESDVAKMKRDLPSVFSTMKDGNCTLLRDAFRVIVARAEEDERIAAKLLTPDFKLDESLEWVVDAEKRGYAKTAEERAELVRKMMHFQISNLLAAGQDMAAARKQLLHRYELNTKRLKERDSKGMVPTIFAEEFAEALDPHSSFMSADTLAEFQIQMRLSLEGIGAALSSEDGVTVIETLVPGGQAEKSNRLRPKDKIIAVAQDGEKAVSTIDMELKDVVKMIRGKKGTRVTLTILREAADNQTFDVTIVRDKIDVKEQAAKITYETKKVGDRTLKLGVIDLPSFYGGGGEEGGRSSYGDMKRLLEEARAEKVDGILLDLSRNGGGLLEDAVKIAGLFIKRGGVVATKSTSGRIEVLEDEDDDTVYSGPLVVMTSPASASAAEILAGALKDYRRAVIVGGEHTFGKGTVQVLLPLPGEIGAMKVTTGMFFLPAGMSTQQKGVASDIRVPSVLDGVDVGEKSLAYSLPPQSTAPFISTRANAPDGPKHWRRLEESELAALGKKSAERVAKDPQMAEIQKQLQESKENKGVVKLGELRRKAKEEEDAASATDKDAAGAKDGNDAKDAKGKGAKGAKERAGKGAKGADKAAADKAAAEKAETADAGKDPAKKSNRDKFQEMQAAFIDEGENILVDLIGIAGSATGTRYVGAAEKRAE